MRTIPSTAIISIDDNDLGYMLYGYIPSGGASLPTTANTFAVGCEITDNSTGFSWVNMGTVAAPVWESKQVMLTASLTAAQIIAMYATPVQVIPAIPGKAIVLDSFEFDLTGTATQFTGGGVVDLQYDSTANGAGTTLHADIAASVVNNATGRVISVRRPSDLSAIATASITGKGVYISNKTAAFATGTGTAVLKVRYHFI